MYRYSCAACGRLTPKVKVCPHCKHDHGYARHGNLKKLTQAALVDTNKTAHGYIYGIPDGTEYIAYFEKEDIIQAVIRPRKFEVVLSLAGTHTFPFKSPWIFMNGSIVTNGFTMFGISKLVVPTGDNGFLGTEIFSPSFGNIRDHGAVCWGLGNTVPDSLKNAYGQFFSSPFNNHLTNYHPTKQWVPLSPPEIPSGATLENTVVTIQNTQYCTMCRQCRCHECMCLVKQVTREDNHLLAALTTFLNYFALNLTRSLPVEKLLRAQGGQVLKTQNSEAVFFTANPLIVNYASETGQERVGANGVKYAIGTAKYQLDGNWLVLFPNGKFLYYFVNKDEFIFLGSSRIKRSLPFLERIRYPFYNFIAERRALGEVKRAKKAAEAATKKNQNTEATKGSYIKASLIT